MTVTGKITVRGSTADDETGEEQGPSGRKKEGVGRQIMELMHAHYRILDRKEAE